MDLANDNTGKPTMLAFAPLRDQPTTALPKRRDATKAFQPEMERFAKCWRQYGVAQLILENGTPAERKTMAMRQKFDGAMRARVLSEIASRRQLRCIAFFCHGWPKGIQFGFDLSSVHELAEAIASAITNAAVVVLYACDAARDTDSDKADDLLDGPGGEGGFADRLRDEIAQLRPGWLGHVDAHACLGHTTMNPYVRRFTADGASDFLVSPKSPLWPRWRSALKREACGLAVRFPLMRQIEIEEELRDA